jgi:uncharacterized membrane protein
MSTTITLFEDRGVESTANPTAGERAADALTRTLGSWRFLLIQSSLILVWMAVNLAGWARGWDPFPFILLNLMLSLQAAYAGPIIMMSQNRLAQRDREEAHRDLLTDLRAEEEVRLIMEHLERQDAMLHEILRRLGNAA